MFAIIIQGKSQSLISNQYDNMILGIPVGTIVFNETYRYLKKFV